jgi:hypothetical protein
MLQPIYTMNGFNWFDRRGVEGVGFVRTLRTLLTNHLPELLPDLGTLARTQWRELLSEKEVVNGRVSCELAPRWCKDNLLNCSRMTRNHPRPSISHDDEIGGAFKCTIIVRRRIK